MKKFALLSALALGLAFTACDDNDIIDIPTNDPSALFKTENLVMTPAAALGSTVDLAALNNAGAQVELASVSLTDFPSDYELNIVMQISADESFSKIAEVPTMYADGLLTVNPDDLQGAYTSTISKGPKERTIYARYAVYAVKDESSVRIGNPEYYWGPVAITVLPYPSDLVIEEAYYLLGTINGWSVADAIKFNHSDLNQYDDPVFTIKVDITPEEAAAGWWWKIVPQSTYSTGNWVDGDNAAFGVAENGSEELSGMLVGRTATQDCGAGCLKEAGSFLLTINIEEGKYEFSLAIDNLYTPGGSNGWSHLNSQKLYTTDFNNYMGYAHLNGEFKFTSKPDWTGINYGKGAEDGMLSTDGGAVNMSVATDGLYWCNVSLGSLTYSLTQVTTIGVIGNATPAGWDASTALTPSANFLVWEADITFGDGEWKFRANNGWDINLGGELSDLAQNGANLATPGAGTYHVKLDLSTLPYTATLTKK